MTSITIPSQGLRTAWSPRSQSFPLMQDGVPAQVTLTEYVSSSVDYSVLRDEFHRHVETQEFHTRRLWDEIGKLKNPSALRDTDERVKDHGNKLKHLDEKIGRLRDQMKDERNKMNARLDSLVESYEALQKKYEKQSVKLKWHKEALDLLTQTLQETRDAFDFLPGNVAFLEAKQHFLDVLEHGGGAAEAPDCEPRVGGGPEEGAVDRELHKDGVPEEGDRPGPADEGAEEQKPEEGSGEGDEEAPLHPDKRDEISEYKRKLTGRFIVRHNAVHKLNEDSLRRIGYEVKQTTPVGDGWWQSVCEACPRPGGWELSDNFLNDYP